MKLSLFIVTFHLGLLISCVAGRDSFIADPQNKTWCVVTVGAPNEKLQAFLNSACNELDCGDIQEGGSCFEPNTLQNHASYVLNLFFRAHGVCNSEIGTPSLMNPSFGRCHYD